MGDGGLGDELNLPDAALVSELRDMIAASKQWGAGVAVPWIDAGGRPSGHRFRQHLILSDERRPVGLYIDGFYKPSDITRDTFSLTLAYGGKRVLGIDDGGPSHHLNQVGSSRGHYMQRVEHPHLHTISDDAICGYAEPIKVMDADGYWALFLSLASVSGAPSLRLPMTQGSFNL